MANNLLHRGLLAPRTGRPGAFLSEPAHTHGCLLTLGPDAEAAARKYNVMLEPSGSGRLAGGQQTGTTRAWSPACLLAYGSIL